MSKWRYINENSQVFITQKINNEKMPVLIWGQQGALRTVYPSGSHANQGIPWLHWW